MIVGITDGCGGCENDPNVALNSDLYTSLEEAAMKATCDSIFPHNDQASPIPRLGQWIPFTGEQLRAVSGSRVTLEWAFTFHISEKRITFKQMEPFQRRVSRLVSYFELLSMFQRMQRKFIF